MPTLDRSFGTHAGARIFEVLNALADEARMLALALLSPAAIIDEVDEMRTLQVRANCIEATDPARAAVLRWRASRIGLR